MSAAPRILFVCTANVCRSAMAEHLLRHMARARGVSLEVASCGTAAESWFEVPEAVRRLLAAEGVPPFTHVPRLLTREALGWADLVLVMEDAHRCLAVERFPEHARKIRLLSEQGDLPDPMGASEKELAACLRRIRQALEGVLASELPSRPPATR